MDHGRRSPRSRRDPERVGHGERLHRYGVEPGYRGHHTRRADEAADGSRPTVSVHAAGPARSRRCRYGVRTDETVCHGHRRAGAGTARGSDPGAIGVARGAVRRAGTVCCAPSGTSPRPKPSSGLLSGVRADCRLKSRSTVIRPHIAQPKRPWTNIPREIQCNIRSSKYLNNLIEQDHRSVKLRLAPMLGLEHFRQAATTIAGVELMHRIRKGQFKLGRLGAKGNTAPKIWNAVLAA